MRVVCISDTHGMPLEQLNLPEGDVLLHAGDMSFKGTITEMANFNGYCAAVKHKYKHGIYAIPGNHELGVQADPSLHRGIATDYKLMIDESVRLDGLKFWFSPWQPEFYNWAYNLPRGPQLAEKWSQIPDETHVLVTHGGPRFRLSTTNRGEDVGCLALHNRSMDLLDLRLHVFGHIHHAYGHEHSLSEVHYVNASTCNERYKAVNAPIVIDL